MESKKALALEFVNIFLAGIGQPEISIITSFVVPKHLLLNAENIKLFNESIIVRMTNAFESFGPTYEKTKTSIHFVMGILTKIVQELSDKENIYKFYVGNECKITHEKVRIKTDMCACLRNTARRRAAREIDPKAVCVCGLFKYRDCPEITHTSFGDDKIKGNFYFGNTEDIRNLYEFILNGKYRNEYNFVEMMRAPYFQAFFDLDFKLQKHGLAQYLHPLQIEDFTNYIIGKICAELGDNLYVYSDKTVGSGLHLYFPNKTVTKAELTRHVQNLHAQLISDNWLNVPMSRTVSGENANEKIYQLVLDKCVVNNGLALMFQNKNGAHYKINIEKSTYPNIPHDKFEQLSLCQLRRFM